LFLDVCVSVCVCVYIFESLCVCVSERDREREIERYSMVERKKTIESAISKKLISHRTIPMKVAIPWASMSPCQSRIAAHASIPGSAYT